MDILSNNLMTCVKEVQEVVIDVSSANLISLKGNLQSILNVQILIKKLLKETGAQYDISDEVSIGKCKKCLQSISSEKTKNKRPLGRPKGKRVKPRPSDSEPIGHLPVHDLGHMQTRSRKKLSEFDLPAEDVKRQNESLVCDDSDNTRVGDDTVPKDDENTQDDEETAQTCRENYPSYDKLSDLDEHDNSSFNDLLDKSGSSSEHEEVEYSMNLNQSKIPDAELETFNKFWCDLCSYKTNRISHLEKHQKLHKVSDL